MCSNASASAELTRARATGLIFSHLVMASESGTPVMYLWPKLLSGLVEGVLMGVIFKQMEQFVQRGNREQRTVVALVTVVFLLALFQTAAGFYSVWEVCIANYGNWVATIGFTWPERLQPTLTVCLAVPVQVFLIRRCWTLLHKPWYLLVIFGALLLGSVISSVYMTTEVFEIPNTWWQDESKPMKFPLSPTFILILACPAVLDIGVSGILLVYLARSRSSVYSSRFRRIMRRLTQLVWEAALPPCLCAMLTIFMYIYQASENYWDLAFQAIIGKLYVISLFVTLNGRAALQEDQMLPVAAGNCNCGRQVSTYHVSNLLTPTRDIRLDLSYDPAMAASGPSPTVAGDSAGSVPSPDNEKADDRETVDTTSLAELTHSKLAIHHAL